MVSLSINTHHAIYLIQKKRPYVIVFILRDRSQKIWNGSIFYVSNDLIKFAFLFMM